jgi:hypothetical protein
MDSHSRKMLYAMEIKNVLKISVYPFLVIKSFEGGMVPHSKVSEGLQITTIILV